ncbi:MAG: type II secretion system F family protein [Rhizobiaceae bacterium]
MFSGANSLYVVYAAAALFGIIIVETIYLLMAQNADQRKAVNRRMNIKKTAVSQQDVLIQLRKERGLEQGRFSLFSLKSLRVLRTQSGLSMPMPKFMGITTLAAFGISLFYAFKTGANLNAALAFPVLCLLIPFFVLRRMRKKRHKAFGIQLPEALDLMTRGLRAGHPVPVALMMVGREMPDPIGSEFGLVADEITYGSDMITALKAMYDRVGQEDMPLFITAVSIQSTTGGNLREILDGLANVIRERGKLRRKIRAISSEGRASAMILTAVPCLLMMVLLVFVPDYYGDAWQYDTTYYLLGAGASWLGLGNIIMAKMANFRF